MIYVFLAAARVNVFMPAALVSVYHFLSRPAALTSFICFYLGLRCGLSRLSLRPLRQRCGAKN